MLNGFVGGLFTAWILGWLFNLDQMLVEVIQPFISHIELTDSHYYILFGLIGLVGGAFKR